MFPQKWILGEMGDSAGRSGRQLVNSLVHGPDRLWCHYETVATSTLFPGSLLYVFIV